MAVGVISFLCAAASGKKVLFPAALLLLLLLSGAAVAVPVSEFSSPVKVPVFSSLLLSLFLSLSTVASWYSQQDGKGQPLEAEPSSQPSSAQQHPSPSINLRTRKEEALWHCNNKLVMSILARSLLLLLLAMPSLVWGAEEAEHLHLRNPIVHSVDDHSFHNNPFTGAGPMQVSMLQKPGLKKQKKLSPLNGDIDDNATGSRLKDRVPIAGDSDLSGFSENIDSPETVESKFAPGCTLNREMLNFNNMSTVCSASHRSQRPETSLGEFTIPIWTEGAGLFDDQWQLITKSPHTMFFNDPVDEALMVKEVLFVPRAHFRLNKEPEDCKKETFSSIFSVGRCSQGPSSASNQICRLWNFESHQNHAILVDFSLQQEVEIDFRGWEDRLDISVNVQRSCHENMLLIPFKFHTCQLNSSHPSMLNVLNLTGDQKHCSYVLLSPSFGSGSLQEEEEEINGTCEGQNTALILGSLFWSSSKMEDNRGVVESNSTWDVQSGHLFHTQVLSAPTEANVPFPSVNCVGSSGDPVQNLAAADVTEGAQLGQQAIFNGFQRRTGTQVYLSAADLCRSPQQVCIMSAQANQSKELDFLNVLAFTFLLVVAVCFWLLTFSTNPVPPTTQGCSGALQGQILYHIDPFLGLGLIRNQYCSSIGFGALATIVDSLAATLGLALHSNSQKPQPSPPKLPHVRVKLSKLASSGSLQRLKSDQENTRSIPLNDSTQIGHSGKQIHGVSGLENYLDSPDGGAHVPCQHVGNAWSGSLLLGSPRKGTTVKLQKPQILSNHPMHQQPASMMDKEKRRWRKKKAKVTTVNHIASSNLGSSGGSSPPSSPASSPKTPASLSPSDSSHSPFEVQSGQAHCGDPTSPLVQRTVANCNKQQTERPDAAAGWSTSDKDTVCSTGKSSPVANSEGDDHKCSKSKLSVVLPQWDKEPPRQHELGRPTLSISASFPACGSQWPGIKQTLIVDPASKCLNLLPMSTIAPSCRAPGANIAKHSLGLQRDIAPSEKSNMNKFTITKGESEDPNVYDIWGDHLGEAGHFSRQQQHQNGFAQVSEKASSLSKLLVSRSSSSFFSNPIFERSEASSSSEVAILVSASNCNKWRKTSTHAPLCDQIAANNLKTLANPILSPMELILSMIYQTRI
ncbi:hypothetical protein CY35_04G044300 [Sphagnum magellanicum]|nr:hypothetical protein CY35_04G044300 [Sphagnum magellanicum]